MGRGYSSFVRSLCDALSKHRTGTVINDLPYYQYNSAGLYYGTFNRGEGTSASPATVTSWINSGRISCFRVSYPVAGHGVLAARGWSRFGGWSIFDLDTFSGAWKIDDVTFGLRGQVMHAFFSTVGGSVKFSSLNH